MEWCYKVGDVALFYRPNNIVFLGCFEIKNNDKSYHEA